MLAMCWYSGCNFIVFGMKYVLAIFLCVAGCVRRILGIGPGLGRRTQDLLQKHAISPHTSSLHTLTYKT